jgi:hypothetical protein
MQEAKAATGLMAGIAASLGYPTIVVELIAAACFLILLLVVIFSVLALFRIRKEMISLNFKIIYIGRLIEAAVKGPRKPEAAQTLPRDRPKKKPAPAKPTEATEKFKL